MTKLSPALKELEALGQWEKLESISASFGTPFIAEYELEFFRRLYHAELVEALERVSSEIRRSTSSSSLAARGRIRRLLGDSGGAAQDLKAALDLDPRNAAAHAWLGELDLSRPDAETALSRALELDAGFLPAYLYRGASRFLHGEIEGAKSDLRRLIKRRPGTALGLMLLGLCEEKLSDRRGAAKSYAAAARANPVCSAAFLLWSRAETDPRRAVKAAEGALDADPTYALITLSKFRPPLTWEVHLKALRSFAFKEPERAGWYYRQEDIHYSPYQFQEYEDSSRLHKIFPSASWAGGLVGRGVLRCPPDAARAKLGLRVLNQAVEDSPHSGWVHAWRALGEIKDKKPERAVVDFAASIRLQPYYHRAYAWRGALLRNLGRIKEALRDLDRAIAVDEQYAFANHERSLARRAAGDFVGAALDLDRAFRQDFRYAWVFTVGREPGPSELDKAIAELDRALTAHPRVPSLLAWRGQLRLQKREYSKAFVDFEKAVRLDPHHALAHAWYGWGLVESGQPRAAREWLARAVELEPRLWILHGWLAEAEFRSGDRQRAMDRLEGITRNCLTKWWPLQQRAQFHLESGRFKEAVKDVRAALRSEGRHAEGWYILAQALTELGDNAGAFDAVEKALIISPNMGRAYLLRARIRQSQGRHEGVLGDYRTVYERFPYLFNAEQKREVEELLRR